MVALRSWFGPSKQDVWRQLCKEIDGRYIEGSFWKGDKVQVAHGEWTIVLDTYVVSSGKSSTTYTRMRAPYINPDGFRFTAYRKSIFSDIGKWFGMQDIEIGSEPFDQDFILKSNQEATLRTLLADARILELINLQPQIYFTVNNDEGFFRSTFPEGVDELRFQVVGVIKDVDRLKLLFELFAETLDQLCRIGSAYKNYPGVTL